jgi:pimeloyl-ACP methyl ester carboxylesterase
MDWWEDDFCQQVAAGDRYVIRYDHRDTGQSISYQPGSPEYGLEDLVADALGVLDAFNVPVAHIAGMSMGGGIAQRLALDHADRLASMILLSTSPGVRPGTPPRPDLPPMTPALLARFTTDIPATPDWTDRSAVVDHILATQRAFAGSAGVDDARLLRLTSRILERTINIEASMTNHGLMVPGDPFGSRLGEITVPTLVIHGTEDPLFPYGHAETLTREIAGAQLVPMDRVGHQIPPQRTWQVVIPALLRHTSRP